jgi:hypothetical protein
LRYRLSKLGLTKNDETEMDQEFEDDISDPKSE